MKSLILTFLFCTIAALALPSRAVAEAADAPATAASDEADAELTSWVKKLDEAKLRFDVAQRQLDQLTNAKGRGAARRYPRGDAKAKFLEDLENARVEYEAARAALPEVVEEARRAGVAPRVLEPYESAAEPAAPPANADADVDASDEDSIEAAPGTEGGAD